MKDWKRMFLCSVTAAAALTAVVAQQASAADIKPPMAKFSMVSDVVMEKCMACHSRNYDLPFYAKIPGIRQIIEQDYRDGLRAMDLNAELVEADANKPVGETTLAKMEWVINNNTMPPAKFTVVHWSSRLSEEEKKLIRDWVRTTRAEFYATGTAAPRHANEPVQPVPQSLPVKVKSNSLLASFASSKNIS